MFKSFLGLWLLVFAPLIFLVYPSSYSPIVSFNENIEQERYTSIYTGTFFLIESQLDLLDQAQWPDKVSRLASSFGYGLRLVDSARLNLNEKKRSKLSRGDIVFVNDEPEYLLKNILSTSQTLQLYVDYTEAEKIISGAVGTISLIKQEFEGSDPSQWEGVVSHLDEKIPFNLSMVDRASITVSEEEKEILSENEFFWRDSEGQNITFYIPLDAGGVFLIAKKIPLSSVDMSVLVLLILGIVAFISIGMFLWVYPLRRDLKRLTAAATHFGQGRLDARAQVSKISVVATLGSVFNQMAEQIQQLIHGQRTMTNAIAHDLRTPLYRLRFAFEMQCTDGGNTKENKYAKSIANSLDTLDHLISQILLLSKYSSDRNFVSFKEYPVDDLVRDECEQTFPLYPDVDYTLQIESGRQYVSKVDKTALRRAFNNLLTNACKFAQSHVWVSLTYEADRGQYLFIVSDDGSGLDETLLEKIFLPFEQLDNARNSATGYGLGLAIVEKIAAWHSGKISAKNVGSGGAKFTFSWPASS